MYETDSSSAEDVRWAKARHRARGIADRGLGKALTRYFMLYFPASLLLFVFAGAVVASLAFGLAWNDPANLQLGLILAGVGTLVLGLIYNSKWIGPAADVGSLSVLLSLESDEQKLVRRQVLRKTPPEESHLVVSRAAAVQLRKNAATHLMVTPILPLILIPQAFPGTSSVWWLTSSGVLLYLVGSVLVIREFRSAGHFLRETEDGSTHEHPDHQ